MTLFKNINFFRVLILTLFGGVVLVVVLVVYLAQNNLFIFHEDQQLLADSLIEVTLPPDMNRIELAETLGEGFGWSDRNAGLLASVYARMQWAKFNDELVEILTDRFSWKDAEREVFLTHSTEYLTPELDTLSKVYWPGLYTFPKDMEPTDVAGILVEQVSKRQNTKTLIKDSIPNEQAVNIQNFVQKRVEYLPDLVPLPAQDIKIEDRDYQTLMLFSTTYYNRGRGPLELVADSSTKGIQEDVDRNVFQRVHRKDGDYREKIVGTFLWHQPHLHYHFSDFITYDLEIIESEGSPDLSGIKTKQTFCIRDVSRVFLELEHATEEAGYLICNKEVQGVSVGWGDTYFYNYPDQALDVSELPTGTYRLTFNVNPDRLFDEDNYNNNKSSVVIEFDADALTAEIIESTPENTPRVEHVYPEQDCSNCTL